MFEFQQLKYDEILYAVSPHRCASIFKGLLNVQAASGVASRPVANFDPEGNQTNAMKFL